MKKHYITFLSPGTFMSEQTVREVGGWNIKEAMAIADTIDERHGATPYGFYFTTKERGPDDWEPKQTKRSNMYFLGGKVETLEEIIERNDPEEKILRSNMECNGYKRVIVNTNSYRSTMPLDDEDVVLQYTPPSKRS